MTIRGSLCFVAAPGLLLLTAAAMPALGQPVPPNAPPTVVPPVRVDAAVGLKDIAAAYRERPTADRIVLALREGGKIVRRDEIVCRMAPVAADESHPADVDLSLDLGPLRLYASRGMLVVTHVSKAETFYRHDYEAPLTIDKLAAIVPPLLLPQLAFAVSAEPPSVFAPYCRGVRFRDATINPADEQPVLTVSGATEKNQSVTIVADGKTGRLRSMNVGLQGSPARTLEATISAMSAESPGRWMPALSGRQMVSSVDKLLRSVDRPVEPGQRFPAAVFYGPAHERLRIEDLTGLAGEGNVTALVLFDAPDDAGLPDAAADACMVAAVVRQEIPATAVIRIVAVVDAGAAITDGVKERGTRALTAIAIEKDVLWTTPRAASLGRLAPDAACVVVFIGHDTTVRATVAVVPEDFGEASTLAQRIKDALRAASFSPDASKPQPSPSDVPASDPSPSSGPGGG